MPLDTYGFAITLIFIFVLVLLIFVVAYVHHNKDISVSENYIEQKNVNVNSGTNILPVSATLNMLIELLIGVKSLSEPTRFKSASTGNSIFTWRTDLWKISLTFNSDNLPVKLSIDSDTPGKDVPCKY